MYIICIPVYYSICHVFPYATGQLVKIFCIICVHVSVCVDLFISVFTYTTHSHHFAVCESFKNYTSPETLDGDNKYLAGSHGMQVRKEGGASCIEPMFMGDFLCLYYS